MELSKLLIVVGEAANVIEGTGSDTTACAVCTTEPPAPVQVSVKLVVDVRGAVDKLPLVGCVPLQPPDAVQVCALLALQVNVALSPIGTVLGVNCSWMAGFPAAVAAAASLKWFNEFWSPQAASAAIAVNPSTQRDRPEATALRERSRSQWATTNPSTFNVELGAWRRLRPIGTIIASPSRCRCPSDISCMRGVITSMRDGRSLLQTCQRVAKRQRRQLASVRRHNRASLRMWLIP